ncbi:MAG TPA: hypothetical protein VN132_02460, partial [Bdellovibrio sp.]|nr:hypothetical protein [Bdellovibrio sp.]
MGEKSPSKSVEILMSPQGYFQEVVKKGLTQRKIQTVPHVENYLVNILHQFLDARNLFESTYANESGQKN